MTTPTRDEAVPTGWKLVPIEPTDEMMWAGYDALDNLNIALAGGEGYVQQWDATVYRAMLASAPAPASGGAGAVAFQAGLDAAAEYLLSCDDYGDRHKADEIRKITPPAYSSAGVRETLDAVMKDVLAGGTGVTVTRLDPASLSPAATPVSEAEPVAWQVQFDDGNWSKAIYSEDEIKGFRQTIITDKRLLYALAKQTAKPASSPAGGGES